MPASTPHKIDRRMVHIAVDDFVEYDNSIYKITQIIDFKEAIGINLSSNEVQRLLIQSLKPITIDATNNGFINRDIADISDHDWKEIERRLQGISNLLSGATRAQIEQHAKELGVHYTTLYRWLHKYQTTGTLTGLLPFKNGRKEGLTRLDPRVDQIIQDCIERFYLNIQRPCVQVVIDKVFAECYKANCPLPGKNTIRNRIAKISEYDRLKQRGNIDEAKNRFSAAAEKFEADYPLHIVQIDHTLVDIILVDDTTRQPIGRPWITLMIDLYSRMIVGYFLSLDAPSATSVAMCISNAMLPKDNTLLKYDIDATWNIWGKMDIIHTDNGADFRTDTLKKACQAYGINIQFRPINKKQYGGHIERLIGTIMKETHALPGTTFSNIKERDKYDSRKHAAMTFDEFEKWLVTFITKIYHKRKHASIGIAPEEKWKQGIIGNSMTPGIGYPPKPSDPTTILLDFLPLFYRTIQRNGVNIEGLNYYDHTLRPFINQIDSKTKKKKQFIFKRDIRDISYVWFYDETTQNYYKIRIANAQIPAMSLWEYKEIRKRIGKENASDISVHEIIKAREELHSHVIEASKKTSKARRQLQKVTNLAKSTSRESLPTPAYPPTTRSQASPFDNVSPHDEQLWDDDLPVFD